jgi:hypothetical protein
LVAVTSESIYFQIDTFFMQANFQANHHNPNFQTIDLP